MSTISVVIVAFYLDLSIDLSCVALALKFIELGESIGRGENLIAGVPLAFDEATWQVQIAASGTTTQPYTSPQL
jgi:hypothetical protein